MKKILLVLILFVYGCGNKSKLDVHKEYYDSGVVKNEVHSKDSLIFIEYFYDETGELKYHNEYGYNKGRKISDKQYNSSGQLISYFNDENPYERLYWVKDYYPSGQLKVSSQHNGNDELISEEEYYMSGQLKRKFNYNGLCESYFEDGQLNMKCNRINGNMDGLVVKYFENGNLDSKYNYKIGKMHGVCEKYHKNGQLDQRQTYEDGKRIFEITKLKLLLLFKRWGKIEDYLGKPTDTYTMRNGAMTLVYEFAAKDSDDGEYRHMAFFVPNRHITTIWTCKPGEKLQINLIETIKTSSKK